MLRFVVSAASVFVILVSGAVFAQEKLSYKQQVFDFGHVGIDFNVFHQYYFANPTDKPIKITDIEVSCDCSSVMQSDTLVMPGDTVYFVLTFNTRDYYGPTNKSFTVFTDHPDIPELKYYNMSTVGQWFQGLKPSNISLFFIPGRNSASIKIPNRKFDEISFGRIMPFDTTFTYNVVKESAETGEAIEIEVFPIQGLVKGTRLSSLTFEVERSGEEKPAIFSIPVKIVRY